MILRLFHLILPVLILFPAWRAWTQSKDRDLYFETISLEEGLSQSTVRAILQDRRGFIWIGTEDGLNKYDGYGFTVYKPVPNDPATLSSNFLRALCEDSNGIIWVGTNGGGLNRFDPTTETIIQYRWDRTKPNSLSHDYVWAVHEDQHGMLWLGTDGGGLNRFDPSTGEFTHYRHDPGNQNSPSNDRILTIVEDGEGYLWLGTYGGGLNRFDPRTGKFLHFRHDANDPNSLSADNINDLHFDRSGILWVATDGGGLNQFQKSSGTFRHYRHSRSSSLSLSSDRVTAIFEDAAGELWVGTNGGGLNKFLRKKGLFLRYRHDPENEHSLANDIVFSMYQDHSGVLWIGTEFGGISKLDQYKNKFTHYKSNPDDRNSLNDNSIWSIYEDGNGLLWIGTRTGGLNSYDRSTGRYRHFLTDPSMNAAPGENHVRCILEDSQGKLWVGTDGGGLYRFDPVTARFDRYRNDPLETASLSCNRVYSLYEDKDRILWIGTRTGGLNRLDLRTGEFRHFEHDSSDPSSISNDFVYKVFEDRAGVLWLATFSGGLNRYDRETGTFTSYRTDVHDSTTLSHDCVLTLCEDRAGRFWVGTGGGGLNLFNRRHKTFRHFDENHGLANNMVYSVLEDMQGNLWLSTNKGISRFDPATEEFQNYSTLDGLQSNEFNGGAYLRSASGEMFFGGINGISSFYPESIIDNPYIPPVYITNIRILDAQVAIGEDLILTEHISFTDEITLSHDQNVFSVEFVALNYTIPEKNRYRYMLEGFDNDWIYTTADRRMASYMNLDPGQYVFRIQASNNDGIWNYAGTSLRITITPPFWRTFWFQGLVLLFLIGAVLLLFRRRIRIVRMKTELLAAHNAQMSIMPQKDPVVPGFQISGVCFPANEVGGDFFDFFWLDEEESRFGIAIGDVSGKAMNSAMTAVMSSGMIFAHAGYMHSVSEIVTRLNRPLYLKTRKNTFSALCLSAIDINTRTMTFTNAGLCMPLRKSSGVVSWIEGNGLKIPLGLVRDAQYDEKTIQLLAGDVLVFMTDGVTDAQNSTREFYGTASVEKLVAEFDTSTHSAASIRDAVIDDIRRFTSNGSPYDDMTVVVVKVLSS